MANWTLDSATGKYKSIVYNWILAREPQTILEKYISACFFININHTQGCSEGY